jgi:hypothetical protein
MSPGYRRPGADSDNSLYPDREPCDIIGVARCDDRKDREMRTININGNRFALPQGMSTKDVQALVGFLATLQTIEAHYDYGRSDYLYDLGRGPELRLEDITLTENAKGKAEVSYQAYKAKRAAEEAKSE